MNKTMKTPLLFSVIAGLLLISSGCKNPEAVTAPRSMGTVSLYDSDGNMKCSFEATSREENIEESSHCGRIKNGFINLNGVPSTTKIWLIFGKTTNSLPPDPFRYCSKRPDLMLYGFELQTVKEPTTLPKILQIPDIKTLPPGQVVAPGLRLISKVGSALSDVNVSCFIVEGAQ